MWLCRLWSVLAGPASDGDCLGWGGGGGGDSGQGTGATEFAQNDET